MKKHESSTEALQAACENILRGDSKYEHADHILDGLWYELTSRAADEIVRRRALFRADHTTPVRDLLEEYAYLFYLIGAVRWPLQKRSWPFNRVEKRDAPTRKDKHKIEEKTEYRSVRIDTSASRMDADLNAWLKANPEAQPVATSPLYVRGRLRAVLLTCYLPEDDED